MNYQVRVMSNAKPDIATPQGSVTAAPSKFGAESLPPNTTRSVSGPGSVSREPPNQPAAGSGETPHLDPTDTGNRTNDIPPKHQRRQGKQDEH